MGLQHTRARYERRRVPVNANGALRGAAWRSWTSTDLLATALVASGSSKAAIVEVAGIEPSNSQYLWIGVSRDLLVAS